MAIPKEYVEAGKIAIDAISNIGRKVKPAILVLEICNTIESFIRERGGKPAFPCNVSLNNVAAHYTADIEDQKIIHDLDVVKIDIGVHINGYMVDTATTICLNPVYEDLIKATEVALKEALKVAHNGIRAGEIGRVISSVASNWGFKPISNLSGHSLEQYKVHGGFSIPNVWVPGTRELQSGCVYAIEPFLTMLDSVGEVVEGNTSNIFSIVAKKPTGDRDLDRFLQRVWDEYHTLPFTPRYFIGEYTKEELRSMFTKLVSKKILRNYLQLVEPSGKAVAQFEHTLAITDEGTIFLTY